MILRPWLRVNAPEAAKESGKGGAGGGGGGGGEEEFFNHCKNDRQRHAHTLSGEEVGVRKTGVFMLV